MLSRRQFQLQTSLEFEIFAYTLGRILRMTPGSKSKMHLFHFALYTLLEAYFTVSSMHLCSGYGLAYRVVTQDAPLVTLVALGRYIDFLFCGLLDFKRKLCSFYSRPAELPKDVKAMSPDLPVLTVVFLIVSWTTCGAFAILLSYLYYVFKVCRLSKARRPRA